MAHEETAKQTQLLLQEIEEHKKTDLKLQQAMKIADSANQAKSRFLSNMSHEIRSPLNSIVGYAHILHQDPSIPAHRRQAVETLKRSGDHLCALIEDILDIARIEARKFDFKYHAFNFPIFIEHLMQVYQAEAQRKGLNFNCKINTMLPQRVRGDEKRVGQILMNLLGNAIKFTETGSVMFRIGYSGGVASFQVIDTGSGIDELQQQNIFQPFTRLDNSTGNAIAGSGLGLTISKILTEVMGGELTVQSQPSEGSTFSVRLLLPSQEVDNDADLHSEIIGYQGRRRQIMVVDDQYDHRALLLGLLEPLGFYLSEAGSGEECLQKAPDIMPDLLLMDISMTGMDGIETVIRLRELKMQMPILVLSANAYPGDQETAIIAGCNDFLAKPLRVAELLSKLKQHLNLTWQYKQPALFTPSPSAPLQPMKIPSPTLLEPCLQLVRIGDLIGLQKYLTTLKEEHTDYTEFFCRLSELSSEFRLGEIRNLLNLSSSQESL